MAPPRATTGPRHRSRLAFAGAKAANSPRRCPRPPQGHFLLSPFCVPGKRCGNPGPAGEAGEGSARLRCAGGCPVSVPPSPLVSFALISSASKARSDSRFVYICLEGSGSKKAQTFSCFSACNCSNQGGKNPTKPLKGLSDLNRAIRPCSCPGAVAFFERFRGSCLAGPRRARKPRAAPGQLCCAGTREPSPFPSPASPPLPKGSQCRGSIPAASQAPFRACFQLPEELPWVDLWSNTPCLCSKRHKQTRSLPGGRLCLCSSLSPAPWQVMG